MTRVRKAEVSRPPSFSMAVNRQSSTNQVIINLVVLALLSVLSQAQIVSHELRRLAVATNQFGFDSLRALDEIEPPDKVLVFCPVCLSSSLMMIMMGSSKYQVVSTLRHALYVLSMRPQDINRGFKDIFDHIGLNQNQLSPMVQPAELRRNHFSNYMASPDHHHHHHQLINEETRFHPMTSQSTSQNSVERSLVYHQHQSQHKQAVQSTRFELLSLPSLIKLKSDLESRQDSNRNSPWWHSTTKTINRGASASQDGNSSDQFARVNHALQDSHGRRERLADNQRDRNEMSQMSAMCNIYIQRGLTMNYNYNLLLRQYYETVIHPVDFVKNTEETRQHINALVAATTENKIKDLVKRDVFDRKGAPKIMIISTFHFRGTLDIEMKAKRQTMASTNSSASQAQRTRRSNKRNNQERNRRQAKAHGRGKTNRSQFIETEPTLLKYGHFASMDSTVIEVPFNNRLVTLVIVMPNHQNSTELLLTRLSAQILSDMISSLVVRKLSLEIPVIKFDRGPINTEALLRGMGIENIFFGNQTFTTETGLNRWMRASDIIHETSIDIGTLNPNWGVPEDRLKVGAHEGRSDAANHLRLDKPFFYFVMDSINGLILTMGRIRQ